MANSNQPKLNPQQTEKKETTRIKYKTTMRSDYMREYIGSNIGSLIMLYGRIGGLLRLVDTDERLSSMVEDWVSCNEKIAFHQLEETKAQLEQIQMQSFNKVDIPMEIERPAPINSTWSVNHSSFTGLIRLLVTIDEFLVESEEVYFKGLMSDVQVRQLSLQTQNVISSYLERILKATSPGRRIVNEQYKYSNRELHKHIKDAGYRLEFYTLPKELASLVEEYNNRYSRYKSLVDERDLKTKKKFAESAKANSTPPVNAKPPAQPPVKTEAPVKAKPLAKVEPPVKVKPPVKAKAPVKAKKSEGEGKKVPSVVA